MKDLKFVSTIFIVSLGKKLKIYGFSKVLLSDMC